MRENNKKKLVLGVLALATVFALVACGNKENVENNDLLENETNQQQEEIANNPSESESVDNTNQDENSGAENSKENSANKIEFQPFEDIIETYQLAARENWDMETVEEKQLYTTTMGGQGIRGMIEDGSLYYTLLDLNNDAKNELIVFQRNGVVIDGQEEDVILGIYAEYKNSAKAIVVGAERDNYYFRANNIIENRGSSGAADSVMALYQVAEGLPELVELVKVRTINEDQEALNTYEEMCRENPYQKFDNAIQIVL